MVEPTAALEAVAAELSLFDCKNATSWQNASLIVPHAFAACALALASAHTWRSTTQSGSKTSLAHSGGPGSAFIGRTASVLAMASEVLRVVRRDLDSGELHCIDALAILTANTQAGQASAPDVTPVLAAAALGGSRSPGGEEGAKETGGKEMSLGEATALAQVTETLAAIFHDRADPSAARNRYSHALQLRRRIRASVEGSGGAEEAQATLALSLNLDALAEVCMDASLLDKAAQLLDESVALKEGLLSTMEDALGLAEGQLTSSPIMQAPPLSQSRISRIERDG